MLKYSYSIYINIVGVLLMKLFGLYKVFYAIKCYMLTNHSRDGVVCNKVHLHCFGVWLRLRLSIKLILAILQLNSMQYFM